MNELNTSLSTVSVKKAADITSKVSQFYEGMDLATAIVSVHILLHLLLQLATPEMISESHSLYFDEIKRLAQLEAKEQE